MQNQTWQKLSKDCVFLERLIEEGHINPDQTNIYKILEFRTPQNKKQILGS